jgi:hypothetical protein
MAIKTNKVWSKVIRLVGGSYVRIKVIGHLLDMSEDDRTFVENIVDLFTKYEADVKNTPKEPA